MVLASEIVLKRRFEDDENFTSIKSGGGRGNRGKIDFF